MRDATQALFHTIRNARAEGILSARDFLAKIYAGKGITQIEDTQYIFTLYG
jgi:hypothetical protein